MEEYSFGQTTLEQVFIEFAKQQEEADRREAQGETNAPVDASKTTSKSISRLLSVESEKTNL